MNKSFEKIVDDFIALAKNNSLSHAYFFYGKDFESMSQFSLNFASFLEEGNFDNAKNFLSDLLVIEQNEKGNIGIDEAKKISNFLYQKPVRSLKKMAVILNGDALTEEAQSALLKIIEEPPKDSLIFIIANDKQSVLSTITSRMQTIFFPSNLAKTAKNIPAIEVDEENFDDFFNRSLVDLKKDLRHNSSKVKKLLETLAAVRKYNTNQKLQIKFLKAYFKDK